MDGTFLSHNGHLESIQNFLENDPQLRQLISHKYVYDFALLNALPTDEPGIYSLTGTYLTGKTTLLKNWIKKLLLASVDPQIIAFFPGKMIENYHVLERLLQKHLASLPKEKLNYIVVDDINLIRDWQKTIKELAATGAFDHTLFLFANTDNQPISETKKNFHLAPLTFHETLLLKYGSTTIKAEILYEEFNNYLQHGGFLDAINDMASKGFISDSTLLAYAEKVRNNIILHGKHERYLREILNAVIKHYNQQTSWNTLAKELSIDHPKTIGDYFASLESIEAVFVQYALLEDTLEAAPKKAKKLMFTDPFIYHAIQAWLNPVKNFHENQIRQTLNNPEICSKLAETCVITHFRRYYPTYYIKAEGEVDLAYIQNQRFWPIEISWMNSLRAKDLKQILKYSNGRILTKTERSGLIEHIRTEPLPLALWQLDGTTHLS